MYAQIIDDTIGKTLVAASTTQKEVKAELEKTNNVDAAAYLGTVIGKKAYEASIEAVNKGKNQKSAYEEYLERQELETAKKAEEERKAEEADTYWDRINTMYRGVFLDPIRKNTCTLCFCYPLLEPVWVHTFVGSDNNLWVNIFYYDNEEVGEMCYAGKIQSYELKKYVEDTGEVVPSIEMKLDNGNLTFIQDATDPYKLDILVW